jgi:hypothetical protein
MKIEKGVYLAPFLPAIPNSRLDGSESLTPRGLYNS